MPKHTTSEEQLVEFRRDIQGRVRKRVLEPTEDVLQDELNEA